MDDTSVHNVKDGPTVTNIPTVSVVPSNSVAPNKLTPTTPFGNGKILKNVTKTREIRKKENDNSREADSEEAQRL